MCNVRYFYITCSDVKLVCAFTGKLPFHDRMQSRRWQYSGQARTVVKVKVKSTMPLRSVGGVLISLSYSLWARRWINHWSLWRMASATPDLRLPSWPQSITALWPVPNCTAWSLVTEEHVCEQLAQGCYLVVERLGIKPATCRTQVRTVVGLINKLSATVLPAQLVL